MKQFFRVLWSLFVLITVPISLVVIYRSPTELGAYALLVAFLFIVLCTLRLLQEGYRPWQVLGDSKTPFWLALAFRGERLEPQ